ncbi:MAG: hypothetical protein JOZ15_04510 [Acidobacteria bacterium]|nr:hypothetical protein [Acidobacteriota bacterium]
MTALVFAAALSVAATAQPPAPALVQPALNAAVAVAVGVHGTVGVDFFYSNLAPYGYWVNRPSYGWVWTPRHIRHGWRPYSYGRWVYTDYGWTWVSSEPFGWATYHYVRWALDPDYGWEWVPGTDWGPSWVSWQEGNGYLGWAPLPPEVGFNAGVGLDFGSFNVGVGIDPGWYCFAPERNFLAANVGAYVVSPYQNAAIFRNTTNITNYRVENGRVFNGSVPLNRIQQATGQPVRQLQLANASDPRVARVNGNSVAMFRPASVVRRANAPDPPRVAPRSVATGRVAQQLVQQRRSDAAQFHQAGNQRANASARSAQVQAGRNAGSPGNAPAARSQRQAQAQRQAAPAGRQQRQALGRRQVTPAPQRTRGGMPPRSARGTQQVHNGAAPSQRALGRRQETPAPQRTRGGMPPRTGQRSQQVRGYVPPSQRSGRVAPPQRAQQSQVRRQSAPPPQRQAQMTRQSPPPQRQAMRQSAPPQQRQAQVQRQAPPPRAQRQAAPPPPRQSRQQQQRRQGQPPPPNGGGNR